METIWKYVFSNSIQGFDIPTGAKILHVGADPETEKPTIWALVNTENKLQRRLFEIIGTGRPTYTDCGSQYVGSMRDGEELMAHIFEHRIT